MAAVRRRTQARSRRGPRPLDKSRKEPSTVNERDRQRKRALIVFQIFIYGYLLIMFCIQLSMWATRNW